MSCNRCTLLRAEVAQQAEESRRVPCSTIASIDGRRTLLQCRGWQRRALLGTLWQCGAAGARQPPGSPSITMLRCSQAIGLSCRASGAPAADADGRRRCAPPGSRCPALPSPAGAVVGAVRKLLRLGAVGRRAVGTALPPHWLQHHRGPRAGKCYMPTSALLACPAAPGCSLGKPPRCPDRRRA